ncbi:uncharacterized protein KGF55_001827 [Candida pseudojiufengensis]|uniref:uncharacterized protein n=1 Tax=Candida pseudojiufengensis TaxID=497109 RepID=UPI0022245826|nr:uncharacterized protein KGF55_001827 [Candida pseudojiufengensis]KAI5964757.1 hypothetical protein KGF55_001827 [Candida pseudojiufengensis]
MKKRKILATVTPNQLNSTHKRNKSNAEKVSRSKDVGVENDASTDVVAIDADQNQSFGKNPALQSQEVQNQTTAAETNNNDQSSETNVNDQSSHADGNEDLKTKLFSSLCPRNQELYKLIRQLRFLDNDKPLWDDIFVAMNCQNTADKENSKKSFRTYKLHGKFVFVSGKGYRINELNNTSNDEMDSNDDDLNTLEYFKLKPIEQQFYLQLRNPVNFHKGVPKYSLIFEAIGVTDAKNQNNLKNFKRNRIRQSKSWHEINGCIRIKDLTQLTELEREILTENPQFPFYTDQYKKLYQCVRDSAFLIGHKPNFTKIFDHLGYGPNDKKEKESLRDGFSRNTARQHNWILQNDRYIFNPKKIEKRNQEAVNIREKVISTEELAQICYEYPNFLNTFKESQELYKRLRLPQFNDDTGPLWDSIYADMNVSDAGLQKDLKSCFKTHLRRNTLIEMNGRYIYNVAEKEEEDDEDNTEIDLDEEVAKSAMSVLETIHFESINDVVKKFYLMLKNKSFTNKDGKIKWRKVLKAFGNPSYEVEAQLRRAFVYHIRFNWVYEADHYIFQEKKLSASGSINEDAINDVSKGLIKRGYLELSEGLTRDLLVEYPRFQHLHAISKVLYLTLRDVNFIEDGKPRWNNVFDHLGIIEEVNKNTLKRIYNSPIDNNTWEIIDGCCRNILKESVSGFLLDPRFSRENNVTPNNVTPDNVTPNNVTPVNDDDESSDSDGEDWGA